jgi:hypothetical protein
MKNIIIILLFAASALPSGAQEPFQKELFPADAILKYRAEIDLSEQQAERVKKIYDDHITLFNSLKWDLDAELVALNKLLAQPHVDEKLSTAQMEKTMKMEDELKRMKLSMLIKIKNELKPAQQDQLKKLRAENEGGESQNLITSLADKQRLVIRSTGPGPMPLMVIKDKKGVYKISAASDIDPNQIQSIEVLKDEAAVKLHGEGARNGVIIVTLKE